MNADRRSGWRPGRGYMGRFVAGFLILSLAPVLTPRSADAQNMQPVFDRLDRLERDIRTLNQQISRPGTVPPAAAAAVGAPSAGSQDLSGAAYGRVDSRLDTLEEDIRSLTGRNEEIMHRLTQIETRLDKLVSDVDFRLGALEQGGARPSGADSPPGPGAAVPPPQRNANGAPVLTPPRGAADNPPSFASQPGVLGTIPQSRLEDQGRPGATPANPPARLDAPAAPAQRAATLPPGTPQQQYAYAQNLMFAGKYVEAEQALTAFVTAHPNDDLTSSALYWRGETYRLRKDYKQAAIEYLNIFQKYPKSPKASESLLKLGMSLGEMNNKKDACAAFSKLRTDYSDAPKNILLTADQERQKYGCS